MSNAHNRMGGGCQKWQQHAPPQMQKAFISDRYQWHIVLPVAQSMFTLRQPQSRDLPELRVAESAQRHPNQGARRQWQPDVAILPDFAPQSCVWLVWQIQTKQLLCIFEFFLGQARCHPIIDMRRQLDHLVISLPKLAELFHGIGAGCLLLLLQVAATLLRTPRPQVCPLSRSIGSAAGHDGHYRV